MPQKPLRRPRAAIIAIAVASVGVLGFGATVAIAGAGILSPVFLDAGRVDTTGAVSFDTPLAIPPLAESSVDDDGRRVFDLTASAGSSEFMPGTRTATWGFNGDYLGPTLVARAGEEVVVNVRNALEEPTSVHWHGMHLPAAMDGGPHQMIAAGADWAPEWTIDQPAATLWYHPHPHGKTEAHVAKGLAGMFIVQDEAESALPLPREYGVDDIPVLVQDARFAEDGSFDRGGRGFVGALGDTLLVNGTVGPFLDVSTELVRLRLVNASTARTYQFGLDDGRDFQLIGTDGGLLTAPHSTDGVRLSPGERAEIVVRLTEGQTSTIVSTPPDLGIAGGGAARNGGDDRFDVLELRASESLTRSARVPSTLVDVPRLDEDAASVTRSFVLDGFGINDRPMSMDRIDEVVEVGATEIWTVSNDMGFPHNFHVHDVQFQVLDVNGGATPAELGGWKDTIYLEPDSEYRLIMRFEDYADEDVPYLYHCHLLWHEDLGMMGQFLVVEPGSDVGPDPQSNLMQKDTAHEQH